MGGGIFFDVRKMLHGCLGFSRLADCKSAVLENPGFPAENHGQQLV